MSGKAYVILGAVLVFISLSGLAAFQFIMRKWKKRYDAEWEHNA